MLQDVARASLVPFGGLRYSIWQNHHTMQKGRALNWPVAHEIVDDGTTSERVEGKVV